ncbi:PEP-CTERM sorting domain-containing protein [Salinisphaera hydrothermalis]|uniref:Ice-binding protein C-terminal domain-containing protein n=1 Tax=Salinisphaera hydrothermalis (strain C41B8) TaxID=1304275 RepID=A0A084II21_SALHC|nr:PEP-CTERM sorting domain-containing protein [Salinisphaera hydrothermalis]KEZ76355.1 hypothetical protein C41B8_15475 [Salinisphaera hydrothermalis C41B8]
MNAVKLGALAVFLLVVSAAANATMITSSYTVDAHTSGSGLVVHTQDHAANPFSYDLNVGQSKTFGLFDIWTDQSSLYQGSGSHPISVQFGFTSPTSGQGTVDGQTYGLFTGFFNFAQEGVVHWDSPLNFTFGPNNDGLIQVSLSDAVFNLGYFGLNSGPCYGATVKATLKYLADPSTADVPEPGTFGLFGLALAAIGFAAYRRRSAI